MLASPSREYGLLSIRRPSRREQSACRGMLGLIATLTLVVMMQFVLFPFYLSHIFDQFPPDMNDHYLLSQQKHASFSTNQKKVYPLPQSASDATFNGIPLILHRHESITSHVHCVGDNYQIQTSWKQRSCHFTNLCFNTTAQDFVLFISKQEEHLARHYFAHNPDMHTSSTILIGSHHHHGGGDNLTVPSISLGGHNLKWGPEGMRRLHWFPSLYHVSHQYSYYALPDNMILLPFHSLNGANPGHLVWDDFLPLYTLLSMFQQLSPARQRQDKPLLLLPMRYVLPVDPNATDAAMRRGLWASCDLRDSKTEQCNHMLQKFGPLLLGNDYPYKLSTNRNFEFVPQPVADSVGDEPNNVDLVCARTALAGISSLTDHGIHKMHGWEPDDYLMTHNHGRGGQLLEFRSFMLRNIGIDDTQPLLVNPKQQNQKHRIIFSQKSSDIPNRNVDFTTQIRLLETEFSDRAHIEAYTFKTMSVQEQVNIVHDASVFISLCGGGAVTAMFLPVGASVILYYSEDGGVRNNKRTNEPAMLDWDLFNAMSYLRVHWMPRNSMMKESDHNALVELIRYELQLIEERVFV